MHSVYVHALSNPENIMSLIVFNPEMFLNEHHTLKLYLKEFAYLLNKMN